MPKHFLRYITACGFTAESATAAMLYSCYYKPQLLRRECYCCNAIQLLLHVVMHHKIYTHGVACGHAPQYDLDCVCLFFTFLYMPSVSGQLSVLQKGTRQSYSHKDHHEAERLVEGSCRVQCASATSTMAGMAHRSTTCTERIQEHHQ